MLRILLDNHLSPALARGLRDRGYDAVALQEAPPPLRDLPDHRLLEEAARQERVLVSYNVRDFVRLHQLGLPGGRRHAGIVLISPHAIRQDDIGGQLRALERFLDDHAGMTTLPGHLHWLIAAG